MPIAKDRKLDYNKIFNFEKIQKKEKILVDINLYKDNYISKLPTFLVFDANGKLLLRQNGYGSTMRNNIQQKIKSVIKYPSKNDTQNIILCCIHPFCFINLELSTARYWLPWLYRNFFGVIVLFLFALPNQKIGRKGNKYIYFYQIFPAFSTFAHYTFSNTLR